MPHQCTTCGRTFPDGSKEMLSGCPDCGGNKFQFKPESAPSPDSSTPDQEQPTGSDRTTGSSGPTRPSEPIRSDEATDASQPTTDASQPTSETSRPHASDPSPASGPSSSQSGTDSEQVRGHSEEDTAQASARSDVVSPDELDRASRDVADSSGSDESSPTEYDSEVPAESRPDLDNLREELNEQFESIRIVSPGQYELNLMELYDRQEYIISLQEDGRYVIEMPDAWGIDDE